VVEERQIEHAATSRAWLRHTLEEIIGQIRRLLDVTGVSFLVVDWEAAYINPAASYFASDAVEVAFRPVLSRPYEPERAGVTEAAIERQAPILIERFEDWPGARNLYERLFENLDAESAQRLWDWYSTSSFISCPVRTSGGRILGVLAIAASAPQRAFSAEDLRVIEVFAELAALALERSELLDQEGARARDELRLNRASQEVSRSLDLDEVSEAIVAQTAALTAAVTVRLARVEPGTATLREVAWAGPRAADPSLVWHRLGQGSVGRVAQANQAELRDDVAHLPLAIGPRVLGVLSAMAPQDGFSDDALARLVAFAPVAAGAVANALDYERERRVATALTAGFVPQRPAALARHDVGVVYEPAGRQASGGDVFGVWTLPDGAVGVLVGDVTGKGLEVAATAAMVRFFVEARTYDSERPGEVLTQTNAILRERLPEGLFVPAFLAVIDGERLRWCNAGHHPPLLLRDGGRLEELRTCGLPLGVDAELAYEEHECALAAGDLLVAATDGLWEARRDGEQFGDARLAQVLVEAGPGLPPQALALRLRDEATAWATRPRDDLVVLAVRVRP
jgi:GAF domain-containing protein